LRPFLEAHVRLGLLQQALGSGMGGRCHVGDDAVDVPEQRLLRGQCAPGLCAAPHRGCHLALEELAPLLQRGEA
jgi:hypothetical protein